MKKFSILLVGGVFLSTFANAAEKSPIEFGAKSTVKIKDVTLSETVKLDKGEELKRVASGLRYKKVAFFTANIYVAQVFSNAKPDQSSVEAMKESLLKSHPMVLIMTFVRDVGAEKLSKGFKETMAEHGVKVDQEYYSKFLQSVKDAGEMKEGDSYAFLFGNGGHTFSFSAHGKEHFRLDAIAPEILANFMLIWFGKAADSGMEGLHKDLLK